MTPDHSSADRTRARTFVIAQFGLLAVLLLQPSGSLWQLSWDVRLGLSLLSYLGLLLLLVAGLSLGRGLTAIPLPNEHAKLRTSGLYRFARHPIYSGLLLFAIAHTAASRSGWAVISCVLLVGLLVAKSSWEEVRLARHFPDYAEYARRTGRFMPRFHVRES